MQLSCLQCGCNEPKVMDSRPIIERYPNDIRHCGRLVKATDQKSIGIIPRRLVLPVSSFYIFYSHLFSKTFSHTHKQTVHILTLTHTQTLLPNLQVLHLYILSISKPENILSTPSTPMLLSLPPCFNYGYIIYPVFNLTKAVHTYVLIIY